MCVFASHCWTFQLSCVEIGVCVLGLCMVMVVMSEGKFLKMFGFNILSVIGVIFFFFKNQKEVGYSTWLREIRVVLLWMDIEKFQRRGIRRGLYAFFWGGLSAYKLPRAMLYPFRGGTRFWRVTRPLSICYSRLFR